MLSSSPILFNKKKLIGSLLLIGLSLLFFAAACKKDQKVYTPIPFLTGKKWTSDTIILNPPATYQQLSANDQQSYRIAVGFFKNTFLIFNEDGTVTGGGDYDFGYNQWRLINNDRDIETISANNRKDTLFRWTADNQRFTYQRRFNQSFDCTILFK